MKRFNPYRLEMRDLCRRLGAAGFSPVAVDDGGGEWADVSGWHDVVEAVLAVDEAHVKIEAHEGEPKQSVVPLARFNLFLVLGNSPGEILADWSYPRDRPISSALLEQVANDHYNQWEASIRIPRDTAEALFLVD